MRFNEAPAIFKRNGKYFLISSGCTGWAPNAARLASADKLAGPWTEHGNPCVGPADQIATTFNSQSTFVLPGARSERSAFIFMADRWNPENAIDGRYIWLPLQFKDGRLAKHRVEEPLGSGCLSVQVTKKAQRGLPIRRGTMNRQ